MTWSASDHVEAALDRLAEDDREGALWHIEKAKLRLLGVECDG